MQCLITGAIFLACVLCTNACSEPEGYRTLPERDVMGNIDLVILGTFLSQENTTQDRDGYTRYLLRLNTQVDCVLRNENNITIGKNIKITEARPGSWDFPGGLCVDYFYDIQFGKQAVISITAQEDEFLPGEFQFQGYNLQGGAYYTDQINIESLMEVCGFQFPKLPPGGGSCPPPLASDLGCYIVSGIDHAKAGIAILFSLLLSIFVLA